MMKSLGSAFWTSSAWCKTAFSGATTRSLCPLLLALLSGILASPFSAPTDPPPWQENLDCDSTAQSYAGVAYCSGLEGDAHVLVIDLYEPHVRLEYIIAEGSDRRNQFGECRDVNIPRWSSGPGCYDLQNEDYYPVMSLLDAVARNSDAAAVINTDYGAGTHDEPLSRGHGPEGFTVVRSARIDGPRVGDLDNNAEVRPWLAVGKGSPLRAEFNQFSPGEDDGSKPDWVYTGVGGAPWLIRNGQIDRDQIDNCTNANPHSCTSNVAQTAVALAQHGRWLYLVVVVGRDAQGMAQFLYDTLRPWQAIKMDGGGSSQLWYGGVPGQNPEARVVFAGDGRRLSQYLAVLAEPGSGIIVEPPPVPPDQPGWLERIWQDILAKLKEWWDQFWAELEARLNELIEEAKRRFVEWLEAKLREFLERLCGQPCATVMLPGVVALLLWLRRARRRSSRRF